MQHNNGDPTQRIIADLKLDNYGYIRLPAANHKRHKQNLQWARVGVRLTGPWLFFYKVQEGIYTRDPMIQINTSYVNFNGSINFYILRLHFLKIKFNAKIVTMLIF